MLLRVQGPRVDRAHVQRLLRLLGEALGQSDLEPAFERACIDAGWSTIPPSPPPDALVRGGMIWPPT